ncbi:hypothetical protein [Thalassobellus citreus]|uniref:hypothetical protein n=1 Tax=Thalassobellus citreus TaxID=3367752 RepID=UPI0037BCF8D2
MKARQVYWFLFPIVGVCMGVLYFLKTLPELFLASVLMNLVFVSILLGVIFLYAKLKLKTNLKDVIGLGDALLFLFLIFGCANISFVIILTCALIFSLLLHMVVSKEQNQETVPLAGYVSLFFGIIYIGFWLGIIDSLYQI